MSNKSKKILKNSEKVKRERQLIRKQNIKEFQEIVRLEREYSLKGI